MLVESNVITINLVGCHNNSSVISGQDAGEAVEEYEAAYMTKEGAPLRQATAVLLSALDDIVQHPSVTDDTGTAHHTGKRLASRTVQTETFRYVSPHAAVAYVDRQVDHAIDEDGENADPPAPDVDEQLVDEALDAALVLAVDPDDKGDGSVGGATAYKLASGDVVFMSQAESYDNRGPHFAEYSALEFKNIVELVPKKQRVAAAQPAGAGRPGRRTFDLGPKYPLFAEYNAVIRLKMRTAVLAGRPPSFPGNKPDDPARVSAWKRDLEPFAKYVLDLLVPWQSADEPRFARDGDGLAEMIHAGDRRSESVINQQRFRSLYHLMSKRHRSSRNELITSLWRQRNTDYWADVRTGKSRGLRFAARRGGR
ncbi:unnamed protein product [Lampetra planeri]